MPESEKNYFIEKFRECAKSKDIHKMSGRSDRENTIFIMNEIIKIIQPMPDDVLLDIGCGDGELLNLVHKRVQKCIGTVSTQEECTRLKKQFPSIIFVVGLLPTIPLESSSATKIVCNSVIQYLDPADVMSSLREIQRISKDGALIFIGEVWESDETLLKQPSKIERITQKLQKDGPIELTKSVLKYFKDETSKTNSMPYKRFLSTPKDFTTLAKDCGLQLVSYFKHKQLDKKGHMTESETRWDFIFIKK